VKPQSAIRLRGGKKPCEGRVEVLRDGVWGTVCDRDWNILDGDVACRQLGLGLAAETLNRAYFGEGKFRVHLGGLLCKGDEKRLEECPQAPPESLGCDHSMDAAVVCQACVSTGSWSSILLYPFYNFHPLSIAMIGLFVPFIYYFLEFLIREVVLGREPKELERREKLKMG